MLKKLTILHSNDIHNSLFFKVDKDFEMHGGISMLSSYVKNTRKNCDNVLYTISGDILQEDISGSDYKGVNTVNIINAIRPDAVSLGNHELDYGLAHLLIFKECINAPVINANILVDEFDHNLFIPSVILKTRDLRILAVGIIPEKFFKAVLTDDFCNRTLEYKESYKALKEEIDKYDKSDYDLIVLMSHNGIKEDVKFIENMPEDIHVDVVLGGHDHINMEEAYNINGTLVAQSSYGTSHIGRFDLTVDTDLKRVTDYKWERVEINSRICGVDEELDKLVDSSFSNRKKIEKRPVCRFKEEYTQTNRLYESSIGDIIADAFLNQYRPDFVMIQSGSIRMEKTPLELKENDLKQLYPFEDSFCIVKMTGKRIREMFENVFKIKEDGSFMSGTFQYSDGFSMTVDGKDYDKRGYFVIEEIKINGEDVEDDRIYKIGMTRNCISSSVKYFNFTIDEKDIKTVSFSTFNDLSRYLLSFDQEVAAPEMGHRFILKNFVFNNK